MKFNVPIPCVKPLEVSPSISKHSANGGFNPPTAAAEASSESAKSAVGTSKCYLLLLQVPFADHNFAEIYVLIC